MSDLTRFIRPLAAAVAALLVLGGVGLVRANTNADEDKYRITAYFTKAIGLFENSDVDILGVPVGKVLEVVPEGTQVRVEMELDSQYKIAKNEETFAQIVPISVISDRYVQLGPVYEGEGEYLQDGDVLETEVTQIPAELDDVFKQLKKLLDAIEPGREGEPGALGDLIVQLNRALEDRERDLQGTLLHGAELTGTLADAEEDLNGLLINLDSLFSRLATRADSMGQLNRNFALVMTALAESRSDLEGTLANLSEMTGEVGRVATRHGDRLGRDLALAAKVTSTVVDNAASVEESLTWLPVLGEGLENAYNREHRDVDVRDNGNARFECEFFNILPDGPIKDEIKKECKAHQGEPPERTTAAPFGRDSFEEEKLDCDKGVRAVRRQLKRLERSSLPQDALEEILDPLRKKLRELKKECKKLGKAANDPSSLLDQLPGVPGLEVPQSDVPDSLTGSAAGRAGGAGIAVPANSEPSEWDRFTEWTKRFLSFLGVAG